MDALQKGRRYRSYTSELYRKGMKDKSKAEALEYDTPLLTLGIDSILALSILVEIEEAYDIEIDDSALNMDKIRDIASFASLVRSYIDE